MIAARYSSVRPRPLAIPGLSAIIRALLGQFALQPASGAPPETYGEKKNHGRNDASNAHATAASSTFSSAPAMRPDGNAKTM
jgi:hypothetical protein